MFDEWNRELLCYKRVHGKTVFYWATRKQLLKEKAVCMAKLSVVAALAGKLGRKLAELTE